MVTGELADWLRERAPAGTAPPSWPAPPPSSPASPAAPSASSTRSATRRCSGPRTRSRGASRDLAELSAGRRLQLLVAVRMGFVEEQERGVRVPIVMDETLANSDDASAEALIGAVVELLARAARSSI